VELPRISPSRSVSSGKTFGGAVGAAAKKVSRRWAIPGLKIASPLVSSAAVAQSGVETVPDDFWEKPTKP
jgi:hypothetical protein